MTEIVLMAEWHGPGNQDVEAEPVLVAVEHAQAVLTLDDGCVLVLDAKELRAALEDAA